MLGQVGIFHRADAHGAGDLPQFGLIQVRVLFLHQLIGALFGFIEQVDQLHRAAVAGLERAAVGAVHGAEAHVLELHAVVDEAGAACHLEGHLEVQGLALVDEIQHAVGVQRLAAIAHGGQVGGGVEVAASSLLHDHRQWITFGVLELLEEDALRAVVLGQQALDAQGVDDSG